MVNGSFNFYKRYFCFNKTKKLIFKSFEKILHVLDQLVNVSMFQRPVFLTMAYDFQFFSGDLKYRLQKLFVRILELLPIHRNHMYEPSIVFHLEVLCFLLCQKMIRKHKKLLMFGSFVASITTSNRSPGEVVSLSITNGSTGNPSVAITVKL